MSGYLTGHFYFERRYMEKRIAVLSVIINELDSSENVNTVLHEYSGIIIGRMGIPYRERGISVISVVVDTDTDTISALTGKLGKINGVSVKAAISKNK
jgi:putative iron-only hydrogenase system regulator